MDCALGSSRGSNRRQDGDRRRDGGGSKQHGRREERRRDDRRDQRRSPSPAERDERRRSPKRRSPDRKRAPSRERRSRSRSPESRGSRDHRSRRDESPRRKTQEGTWGRTTDSKIAEIADDPRARGELGKAQKAALGLGVGTGRNTESFDPKSTLVRPSMRIRLAKRDREPTHLKHDDVVIVPDFFCEEDDWDIYYALVEEMREAQSSGDNKRSEWISWHEGAHLISQNPTGSPTYERIQKKMGDYFGLKESSRGTRFNWYKDSSDWKPFHHDSAAFNPQRARNQNCTVGVSFGTTRELAFLDATDSSKRIFFPQTNGMLFYFGKDVNIRWKHGVNYVEDEQGKGRISIILWGMADVLEEEGSPPMLPYDAPGRSNLKEQSCRNFANGRCDKGDKCRFKH